VPDARALLGPDVRLGVSCHSADEAVRARADGADWIFAGTVFPTPSHPDAEGRGVAWIGTVARRVRGLPVVAIGGVRPDRAPELVDAGAYGVAALRGVWDVSDPAAAVREYIQAMNSERRGTDGERTVT
jgi:thiamine-phosphate diphosphorylase